MMRPLVLGAVAALCSSSLVAAELFVYPSQGQTSETQQQDEYACHRWAAQQTGFDPLAGNATAPQKSPPVAKRQGGVIRGAVRGAAIGEIVDDDWEDGAAAGALIGGMRQRDRVRKEQQDYQHRQQQQAAQERSQRDTYDRAWMTCLRGRGYTVN